MSSQEAQQELERLGATADCIPDTDLARCVIRAEQRWAEARVEVERWRRIEELRRQAARPGGDEARGEAGP